MDDRTYPFPHVDPPGTQPTLQSHDWRAIEDRADAACFTELEHIQARAAAGYPQPDADVPPPFATPPGAALTF